MQFGIGPAQLAPRFHEDTRAFAKIDARRANGAKGFGPGGAGARGEAGDVHAISRVEQLPRRSAAVQKGLPDEPARNLDVICFGKLHPHAIEVGAREKWLPHPIAPKFRKDDFMLKIGMRGSAFHDRRHASFSRRAKPMQAYAGKDREQVRLPGEPGLQPKIEGSAKLKVKVCSADPLWTHLHRPEGIVQGVATRPALRRDALGGRPRAGGKKVIEKPVFLKEARLIDEPEEIKAGECDFHESIKDWERPCAASRD